MCDVLLRGSLGAGDAAFGKSIQITARVYENLAIGTGACMGPAMDRVIVYLATTRGLRIIDATDSDNPVLCGQFDTSDPSVPIEDVDDVPQDVLIIRSPLTGRVFAYVPIWIGQG